MFDSPLSGLTVQTELRTESPHVASSDSDSESEAEDSAEVLMMSKKLPRSEPLIFSWSNGLSVLILSITLPLNRNTQRVLRKRMEEARETQRVLWSI